MRYRDDKTGTDGQTPSLLFMLWIFLFTFGPGKPVPSDPVSPGRPGGPGSPYGSVKRLHDERFGVMNEAVLNVS